MGSSERAIDGGLGEFFRQGGTEVAVGGLRFVKVEAPKGELQEIGSEGGAGNKAGRRGSPCSGRRRGTPTSGLASVPLGAATVDAGAGGLEAPQGGPSHPPLAAAGTEAVPRAASLSKWERDVTNARAAVLAHIRGMAAAGFDGNASKAINAFIEDAKANSLPPEVMGFARAANARRGKGGAGGRAVSRRTVYKWIADEAALGVDGLAPRANPFGEPRWAGELLDAWKDPAKPSLAYIVEYVVPSMLANKAISPPTYSQARTYLMKLGEVYKQRGRMGPRELRSIQTFRRRDTECLVPLEAVTADGHKFDAEVAHPLTGRPFRPEITTIVDIYTRRVVGVSFDLAESALAVMAAVRTCVLAAGVPSIFYCDNGSGYKNAWNAALMARTGTTLTHSRAYNAQAKGIVESLNKRLWVNMAAKRLPTYMGKDMDREARQKAYKETRRGVPGKLISWDGFCQFAIAAIDAYNARPHTGLPKVMGERGRLVHHSPDSYWQAALQAGWLPVKYEESAFG